MKTKTFLVLLISSICFYRCTTPAYLPQAQALGSSPHGAFIKINTRTGSTIAGEFIATQDSALLVLTEKGKLEWVPVPSIQQFKLQYAKPKNYSWAMAIFPLTTISHGFGLLFTGPFNLLVTGIITASGHNAYTFSNQKITYETLNMYARFPQGLPPGGEGAIKY